jgi:HEAT repeat protein
MSRAPTELAADLQAVFEANQALYDAEERLLSGEPEDVMALLAARADALLAEPSSTAVVRQLRRVADLCSQVPGRRAVRTLLGILDHEDPSVRAEAGEALRDRVYERFKELAVELEAALDAGRTGLAMEELPFLLTDVYDPNPVPLMLRFLESADPQVVAAAIEALADYGDPAATPALEALADDARAAVVDDLEEEPVAIGDLARDALALLGGAP